MKKANWKKVGCVTLFIAIVAYITASVILFSGKREDRMCTKARAVILDSTILKFINEQDIINILQEDELFRNGSKASTINEAHIEACLAKKSRIKKAECYLTADGADKCILQVAVTQRKPVLRVMTDHANYYIDSDGEVMKVTERFAAFVPIVTGSVSEKFAKTDLYEFAMFLKNDNFWDAFVEQIDVNSSHELTIVPRVGNQLIKMGTIDNYQQKLEKLLAVYHNGFNKIGWNKYKEINLMYDEQVVCTKND